MRRFIAGVAACLLECTPAPIPAASTPSCQPALDEIKCVLPTVARNLSAGLSWETNTQKAADACGVTVESVISLWLVHTQAESLEGFVPRPQK